MHFYIEGTNGRAGVTCWPGSDCVQRESSKSKARAAGHGSSEGLLLVGVQLLVLALD